MSNTKGGSVRDRGESRHNSGEGVPIVLSGAKQKVIVGLAMGMVALWGAAFAMPSQETPVAGNAPHVATAAVHPVTEHLVPTPHAERRPGVVIVGVPHELRPLCDAVLAKYRTVYPQARVVLREMPASECVPSLVGADIQLMFSERRLTESEIASMTAIDRDVAEITMPVGSAAPLPPGTPALYVYAWGDALRGQPALNNFVTISRSVIRKDIKNSSAFAAVLPHELPLPKDR
ncbi:MAG: hypothetical protein OHK0029_28530 [Armatimonadaceae bacterium]